MTETLTLLLPRRRRRRRRRLPVLPQRRALPRPRARRLPKVRREAIPGGAYWPRFFLFLALSGGPSLAAAADFGGAGILDLPTARMRPDGVLTLGTSQQDTEDIYSVTYQAFPWLEGTFRYIIQNPGGKLESREATETEALRSKDFCLRKPPSPLPSPWDCGICWAQVFSVLSTSWLANAWAERTLPLAWAGDVLPVGIGSQTRGTAVRWRPRPHGNNRPRG